MALRKQREIYLATCLLESIEDENYRNTRKLLVEHHADPNLLIPESNIAPIHYAAGMENTSFAEAAMKLILKYNGNPNVQTIDGETPLHIAVIWNRTLIVEMLLDHGADLSIKDNDDNTPINIAITEKHYCLIPIFKNHVFEKKMQKHLDKKTNTPRTPVKTKDKLVHLIQHFDKTKAPDIETILTPNRTNFNFKEASPYLVNINCFRPVYKRSEANRIDSVQNEPEEKESNDCTEIIEISDSDDNDDILQNTNMKTDKNRIEHRLVRNLFDLTEENIEKHLSMVVKRDRKDSLIDLWRKKVNESRQRKSMLTINENEFETYLSSEDMEKIETQSVELSSGQSVETVIPKDPANEPIEIEIETEDSFFTADEPKVFDTILQTQEMYEHFDAENNIVFYENKLVTNKEKVSPKAILLNTSSESETCTDFATPSDYDTDNLRQELKAFGDVPGPITKNTKRLYLKRLIRYKRRPQHPVNSNSKDIACNFSVELLKSMKDEIKSLDFINEYASLERQMIDSFQLGQRKNMREGNLKKSFNYLLIDPRIAENLLAEFQILPARESWRRFLRSIFYVGKGKSSRPYAHLYDAIKIYRDETAQVEKITKYQESLKLDRIIDIWRSNKGVICLPVFHNITPVEAYTREAAIIDCLGVQNLTNIKRGDYYGIAKSWTMRDRKKLGVLLLYKAMQVFVVEGESQLRPNDIK